MELDFEKKLHRLFEDHENLVTKRNKPFRVGNGIYDRYQNPVLTAAHTPIFWRFDLDQKTNPFLMERLGINATFNSGALLWRDKYVLVVRVEGNDRKSFFAIAESPNGIDSFRFWPHPISLPETDSPDINVADMRLTEHEDGWVYGIFRTESESQNGCGIARTKDLINWDRLPNLATSFEGARDVVLHPEYVKGKYGLYLQPVDGSESGIGWGVTASMEAPKVEEETMIDARSPHTIKEIGNGQGPPPLKTSKGWLNLAYGSRQTTAGLRSVLYLFLTDLEKPWVVTHAPGGYLLAPKDTERVGDVSNTVFANGWIVNKKGGVFIYYGASDTRMHVVTSSVERLLDFALNTPEDGLRSGVSVEQRMSLINRNLAAIQSAQRSGRFDFVQ